MAQQTEKNNMTAVEWFQEQIIKIVNGKCELSEIQIFQQAKQMEKEQIIRTWENGNLPTAMGRVLTAEQYYNETYGKDSNDSNA